MKFAVIAEFTSDAAKAAEIRPAHRQYLSGLLEHGKLAISGPFTDGAGALIVLEVQTREEAEAIVKDDPFAHAGVYAFWAIHPWKPVYANAELLVPKDG